MTNVSPEVAPMVFSVGTILVPIDNMPRSEAEYSLGPIKVVGRSLTGYISVRTKAVLRPMNLGSRVVNVPEDGKLRRLKESRLQKLYRLANEAEVADYESVKKDLPFPAVNVDFGIGFQSSFATKFASVTPNGKKLNAAFLKLDQAQRSLLIILSQGGDNISTIARMLGESRQWMYRNYHKLKKGLIDKLGQDTYDALRALLQQGNQHYLKPHAGTGGDSEPGQVCLRCQRTGSAKEFADTVCSAGNSASVKP